MKSEGVFKVARGRIYMRLEENCCKGCNSAARAHPTRSLASQVRGGGSGGGGIS